MSKIQKQYYFKNASYILSSNSKPKTFCSNNQYDFEFFVINIYLNILTHCILAWKPITIVLIMLFCYVWCACEWSCKRDKQGNVFRFFNLTDQITIGKISIKIVR